MYRPLILNKLNKKCITLVSLYWYTVMHSQQNNKFNIKQYQHLLHYGTSFMHHYGTSLVIVRINISPQSRQITTDQEINLPNIKAEASTIQPQCSRCTCKKILCSDTTLIHPQFKYSGPSSYDRPNMQTTWVTTKILVLTYQSLELQPECWSRPKRVSACAVVNKDPGCVRVSLSPDTRVCGRNFGQCSALYN
jgi:hypothetical protein